MPKPPLTTEQNAVPSINTDTDTDTDTDTTPKRINGLTEEQVKELLAVAGRRKGDPSMDRLMEEVTQFRAKLRLEEIANQQTAEHDK